MHSSLGKHSFETSSESQNLSERKVSPSLKIGAVDESRASKNVVATLPRLPLVEKRDYIKNWILSGDASFVGITPPRSSRVGSKADKRLRSPPSDAAGKRLRRTGNDAKENSGSNLSDEKYRERGKELGGNREPGVSDLLSRNLPAARRVSRKNTDRAVCRFSWLGRKTGKSAVFHVKDDVTPDEENPISDDSAPASPLRWTGYEITDSRKQFSGSDGLSSPVVDAEVIIHPSSSGESGDSVILDDRSSVKSKRTSERRDRLESGPRTPCRWEGYGSPEASSFEPRVPLASTPSEIAASSEQENDHAEDEAKIESESVATTISDTIENVPTQSDRNITGTVDKCLIPETCDSDETYCSEGNDTRHEEGTHGMEKQSSVTDRTIPRNRSDLISEASSSSKNEQSRIYVAKAPREIFKRKKRAKKGSLVAKLQSLVSLRVSGLQIWQYRASRTEFKSTSHQFVKLVIRERETRYGRHFLMVTVLDDSHNLLDDLFNEEDGKSREGSSMTLMIIPEVNGTPKMVSNRIVDVYPPWEVMNRASRLLCVLYFDFVAPESEPTSKLITNVHVPEVRVLEEFQCPCFERGSIDPTCTIKFTNTKPSIMSEMFDSVNRDKPPA